MARRRSKAAAAPGWKIIILILALAGIYLYEQGYFNSILDRIGVDRPALTQQDDSVAQQPGQVQQLKAVTAASGSWYQVYFTRPFYPERPANRNGGLDQALIADIDAAKSSVDIAVFDFDLETVAETLLRAHKRGVRVRLIIDDENLEDPDVAELTGRLQQAGIPVAFDRRDPFMHIKMMIIDRSIVWTGSMNFTINGVYRNNNNMLRFSIPSLTEDYVRRFEYLFAGRDNGDSAPRVQHRVVTLSSGVRIENYFSPRGGAAEAIEERLRDANESIYVLAFSYTADDQAHLLIDKHRAGLDVRGVFEARSASGTGADFEMLKRAGVPVLEDGNCYIMHHKIYIIDNRTVITGSYNFTSSAERSNDENLLIIDDPALAEIYTQEFERIYAQAQNPPRCGS